MIIIIHDCFQEACIQEEQLVPRIEKLVCRKDKLAFRKKEFICRKCVAEPKC